jgi:DNA ligase-1
MVINGRLYSRTLKPIPNKYIRECLEHPALEGLDGELIVGPAFGEGVFARSISGVMSSDGKPDFTFHVFDNFTRPILQYQGRLENCVRHLCLSSHAWNSKLVYVEQKAVHSKRELEAEEEEALAKGYEGLIVRDPLSPYKYGRSTAREGIMGKLKRFADSEARVTGFDELMHNNNAPEVDARGFQVRSSHKAGQTGSGMMGALHVQDIYHPEWILKVGSGFDHELRKRIWDNQKDYLGKIIKYKYLPIGMVDAPRHPIFLGFRHPNDL